MQIQVNGESRQLRGEMNVTGLLQDLQLNVERVAVEINLEILERRDFDARMLKEGDRVEIMSFIGGGAMSGSSSSVGDGLRAVPREQRETQGFQEMESGHE